MLYCFVCMECCQGSSLLSWVAVLLPESECKGTAFFLTTKLFPTFFSEKYTFSFFFTLYSVIFINFYSVIVILK